jgi:hypothetical protein
VKYRTSLSNMDKEHRLPDTPQKRYIQGKPRKVMLENSPWFPAMTLGLNSLGTKLKMTTQHMASLSRPLPL